MQPQRAPVIPTTSATTTTTAAIATPQLASVPSVTPTTESVPVTLDQRVRGLNLPVWGPDFAVADASISRAARINANWVALVSHWYVNTAVPYTGGGIFRDVGSNGAGGNTVSDDSLGAAIDSAHQSGLAVMLKPHVDWTQGGWRGSFYFADDAGRQDWWQSYSQMISVTVQLAVSHQAEAICIGTEFDDINKEPISASHWLAIIRQIRAAGYKGLLTYAANWGPYGADAEYNRAGLLGVWDQLDFIGVDAYYPLSLEKDPTLAQLVAGWSDAINPYDTTLSSRQDNVTELEHLHNATGKDLVFTEIGYPATDYAAKEPANGGEGAENDAAQARAAQAVFDVWNSIDWWRGMFWWQAGPSYNSMSIAGRPVEDVLSRNWAAAAATTGAGSREPGAGTPGTGDRGQGTGNGTPTAVNTTPAAGAK